MEDEPERAPKKDLLACPMCMAVVATSGDLTLPDHAVGGFSYNQLCPSSGDMGIDLGSKSHYQYDRRDWVLIDGYRGGGTVRIQCPDCREEFSIPQPAEGAFDKRLNILVGCRRCHYGMRLKNLREGPDGVWVRKSAGRVSRY